MVRPLRISCLASVAARCRGAVLLLGILVLGLPQSSPLAQGQAGWPPYPDGWPAAPTWPWQADVWSVPPGGTGATGPDVVPAEGQVPDLTGSYRGSGGETVEIRRNRARIWGGQYQFCDCVFFLVGDRLIAYSADTDVVRKYRFGGDSAHFWLIDDAGQQMSFWRVR